MRYADALCLPELNYLEINTERPASLHKSMRAGSYYALPKSAEQKLASAFLKNSPARAMIELRSECGAMASIHLGSRIHVEASFD